MVSELLQEEQEKDGIRGVAGRTGEGWYQRCCRKNRRRMVSEVLQEEREKDGMKGVARKNGRRTGRVRMVLGLWPVGREKVGARRVRMV